MTRSITKNKQKNMEHTVLVTGATAGFGEATARRFLAHGHKVIALGREAECLEALKASLSTEQQKKLLTLAIDIYESTRVDSLVATIPAEFADVTVLVNNASLALGLEPADKPLPEDWDRIIDTNIKGLVHMTRAFLPGMVERQCGHVINISAAATHLPYPRGIISGGTKAFFHQFSLNLRADLIGTPLRVTCIEPDLRFVGDDRTDKGDTDVEALSPDDVAEAIYWSANLPSHMNVNILELMPVQ